MSYNDDNPRDELYRRFLKSLKEPASERFFDEDELVEVFDYAGDIANDYARYEALFIGARLYPDSQALAERRALLYLDLEDADKDLKDGSAAAFVADRPEASSLIFDIVRLEASHPDNGEAALEYLMAQYGKFSDEEIIRFVDLAFDLGCYQWVIDNMAELRKKVSFLPALLYEVMQEADEQGDDKTLAALAEELIESEPFALAYWVMLFKAQARLGQEEEAKQTFDTAKALASDNAAGMLALADAVYTLAPYLQREAIDMLELAKSENPDEFAYADCRCALLVQAGASEKAVEEVSAYAAAHPAELRPMRQLLMCNVADARAVFERYLDANDGREPSPEELDDIISNLHLRSGLRALNGVMEALSARRPLTPPELLSWIETLFAAQKYDKVVALAEGCTEFKELTQTPLKGAAAAYQYTVSLMKLGRDKDALAFVGEVLPFFELMMHDSPMPVRMSLRCFLTLADKIRRHPAREKLYWEYFDMLGYSKF